MFGEHKITLFASYLDKFPNNLGDFSEEQGERLHQDLNAMETRYQRWWDRNMLAHICWTIKRDIPKTDRKRKLLHRFFDEKRTFYSTKKE